MLGCFKLSLPLCDTHLLPLGSLGVGINHTLDQLGFVACAPEPAILRASFQDHWKVSSPSQVPRVWRTCEDVRSIACSLLYSIVLSAFWAPADTHQSTTLATPVQLHSPALMSGFVPATTPISSGQEKCQTSQINRPPRPHDHQPPAPPTTSLQVFTFHRKFTAFPFLLLKLGA